MSAISITWPQLLYISLALVLFYVAELLLFLRKSGRSAVSGERRQMAELRQELVRLTQEIETLKVRLAAVQVQQLGQPVVEMPVVATDTPYAHAIRMAQSGADSDTISGECGISRGEADLIVSLYRTGTLH